MAPALLSSGSFACNSTALENTKVVCASYHMVAKGMNVGAMKCRVQAKISRVGLEMRQAARYM